VSSSVDLPLGAGTNVLVGLQGGPQITLVGLQQQVTTADSVPVTFRFQNAGEVTVNAIVGNPTTVLPQGTPFNFDTGHGG
jgi:copper(I)-binding protein